MRLDRKRQSYNVMQLRYHLRSKTNNRLIISSFYSVDLLVHVGIPRSRFNNFYGGPARRDKHLDDPDYDRLREVFPPASAPPRPHVTCIDNREEDP